jgi:hypothetical protein
MGLYVVLTAFLYQRGSAESRDPDSQHPDEAGYEEAKHRADAPWPVRKGGLALKLYENSLSIVLLSLFVFSFVMHAIGAQAPTARRRSSTGDDPSPWWVSAHTALLVRIVPELAERVPGDRGDDSALHLPAPERLIPI